MFLILRRLSYAKVSSCLALSFLLGLMVVASGPLKAAPKADGEKKMAFYGTLSGGNEKAQKAKKSSRRYPKPAFYGKTLPKQLYKGITLIGTGATDRGVATNATFYARIKEALELIEKRAPDIYALMENVNPKGRRVIYYTGQIGPASFASWNNDYVVNISATNINEDPAFENTVYSLAATLVHELVGHGRQEADGRVWAMYDWCGKDSEQVMGVLRQVNHTGASSGFIEYEANLFAKWFLESVRGDYPNLNEPAVRRYVKTVRLIKRRFPGWYDDRKPATALLQEFAGRFREVCPNRKFTPHPIPSP
jgi:hypothetical protein